jgi:hypothetical protein
MIDLSKYINKKVKCFFVDGTSLVGTVSFTSSTHSCCDEYPYIVANWLFTSTGNGMSMPQIVTITEVSAMNGIAQSHPNINLNDFKGQMCIVKWSNGKIQYDKVWYDEEDSWWSVCLTEGISSDGSVRGATSFYITEIYGEGAYEIKTKETFDDPTDEAVEKAKEAIKDLSEEQIAKLLHSLKK